MSHLWHPYVVVHVFWSCRMVDVFHGKLADDGRVVIPAPLRHRLGMKPGDQLVIEAEGDSVKVRSYAGVLEEVQSYFRQFIRPNISVVDELIVERRAEAAKEKAEHKAWLKEHGRGRGA
jgi:AbrB family looped-hinge helix DNA binding protein